MRHKSGKEMRDLILAVSLSTLLLVLAIIAFFMVSIIVTTNDNIEQNKQILIEQSAVSLEEISENIASMPTNPTILELFNEELVQEVMSGDQDLLYETVLDLGMTFYPVEYMGIVSDGELIGYEIREGLMVDPDKLPVEFSEGGYETLDALGDDEGLYISKFYELDLGILGIEESVYLNMIEDRTAELAAIEDYFDNQRNDLILMLSIASIIAIILTILLTTLGLRYFTSKYVVRPIEELNRIAQEITEGTFKGEVQVDKDSAYAALQGVLRSGQKVLRRLDEEMRE